MAFSRWLCTHSTKSTLVKIVHPGGHVELHDRPVLAAEIMLRNPRCCVAYPNVFRQPWAIVAPNIMLMQGQKFYVVPLSTIRKLQRLSRSPLSSQQITSPALDVHQTDDEGIISSCWFCFAQSTSNQPYTCLEQSDADKYIASKDSPETRITDEIEKEGCVSDENCFTCFLTRIKANGDDESKDVQSTSRVGSSETRELVKKRTKDVTWKGIKKSYKKRLYSDNWQPSLESISEE